LAKPDYRKGSVHLKEQVSGILSVLFILVIFISILAMTYFVTKLIGRGYIVQGRRGQAYQDHR
jgi:hypothetical protein